MKYLQASGNKAYRLTALADLQYVEQHREPGQLLRNAKLQKYFSHILPPPSQSSCRYYNSKELDRWGFFFKLFNAAFKMLKVVAVFYRGVSSTVLSIPITRSQAYLNAARHSHIHNFEDLLQFVCIRPLQENSQSCDGSCNIYARIQVVFERNITYFSLL